MWGWSTIKQTNYESQKCTVQLFFFFFFNFRAHSKLRNISWEIPPSRRGRRRGGGGENRHSNEMGLFLHGLWREERGRVTQKKERATPLQPPTPTPLLLLSHPSLRLQLRTTAPPTTHPHTTTKPSTRARTQIFCYSTQLFFSPSCFFFFSGGGGGGDSGVTGGGGGGAQIRAFAPLTRERTHFYNHSGGGMWGPTKSLQPQGDWVFSRTVQAVGRRARGTCSTGIKTRRL